MDGFVNVLKPSGPTASDIVVRLKGIYKQKRLDIWVRWIRVRQAFCPWRLGKVRNCSIF